MLILMQAAATAEQVEEVKRRVAERGFDAVEMPGTDRTAIGILGTNPAATLMDLVLGLPGVKDAYAVSKPYKLVSREFHPASTTIHIGNVGIGSDSFCVIAGPCAVENEAQLLETAEAVKVGGAHVLRGGAYKPRTSPYSFRGMAVDGLRILAEARRRFGMPVVTEVLDPGDVSTVVEYADILQIGARNMQNQPLLEEVGRSQRPVLLKRAMSATIEEWLLSAEYVLNQGNPNVILCERGIRTFETYTRNTLDLSAVPAVHELSHLPIIVDPSHGTGRWSLIASMAMASLAAGADGIMVEVHVSPSRALSDGVQSLKPSRFADLVSHLAQVAPFFARQL